MSDPVGKPPHPFFPRTDGTPEDRDIKRIHIRRKNPAGNYTSCPTSFDAATLIDWSQVFEMFGGGTYQPGAVASSGQFLVWGPEVTMDGASKPMLDPSQPSQRAATPTVSTAPPVQVLGGQPPGLNLTDLLIAQMKQNSDLMLAFVTRQQPAPQAPPVDVAGLVVAIATAMKPSIDPIQLVTLMKSNTDPIELAKLLSAKNDPKDIIDMASKLADLKQSGASDTGEVATVINTVMSNLKDKSPAKSTDRQGELIQVMIPGVGIGYFSPDTLAAMQARGLSTAPQQPIAPAAHPPPPPPAPPPSPAARTRASSRPRAPRPSRRAPSPPPHAPTPEPDPVEAADATPQPEPEPTAASSPSPTPTEPTAASSPSPTPTAAAAVAAAAPSSPQSATSPIITPPPDPVREMARTFFGKDPDDLKEGDISAALKKMLPPEAIEKLKGAL